MRIFCIFLSLFCISFASEVSFTQSDFVVRTINFVIFFAIVWYLGADKIKQIFITRREGIVSKFENLQNREKDLKSQVQKSERLLGEAQEKAKEIIANAKKEAFMISQQFDARLEKDVKILAISFDERIKMQEKNMLISEVSKALDDSLNRVEIPQKSYVEILAKGVENA